MAKEKLPYPELFGRVYLREEAQTEGLRAESFYNV